ncbi:acyl carrier protein [Gemmatimonas phototrophica]|uniref:Acyl carrier protein n=1 Tax=Gemmatimonas phototrophica TaxID=1379270 RepID=A0A143BHR1_9BACT|nr:acyl carrier protein [Gemmatimonas phototrophica]AMW04141.1 hypothetical protein GEMMAAP_03420 [Gemmatimonas phototrophica]
MQPVIEQVIADALRVPVDVVVDTLHYQKHPQWDSANHVALIGALEDAYGFFIEDTDIPTLHSVAAIRNYVERNSLR